MDHLVNDRKNYWLQQNKTDYNRGFRRIGICFIHCKQTLKNNSAASLGYQIKVRCLEDFLENSN